MPSKELNVQKIAGRLKYYEPAWRTLTNDKFVLNFITGFDINFEVKPVQDSFPTSPILRDSQTLSDVREAIDKVLHLGAIRPCLPLKTKFVSSYFLVRKQVSFRFILNLKKFNKFIKTEHFKIEDTRMATKLIAQDDHMANLDLENAYFLIPFKNNLSKFLRFVFKGRMFEFTCLPFGLSIALFIFTKVMKPVVLHLRKLGFMSIIYLDDILCIGSTLEACRENVKATLDTLYALGFIVNLGKSNLEPAQKAEFLGFIINSRKKTLELPEKKRQKMLNLIRVFSS